MAEAAEQINTIEQFGNPVLRLVESAPPVKLVEVVPEMAEDELIRHRAAKFIGACSVGQEIDFQPKANQVDSLYDAVHKAAEGDPQGRGMLDASASTDVIERTIKAGHVMQVEMFVDEDGDIRQQGKNKETIQANSLRYASDIHQMRERTKHETTNAFRIKQLNKQNKLDDYFFVVFSRVADNMTHHQMTEAGFFTDTMSTAIQATTAKGCKLITETAFVAGVKNPGEERHDAETLAAVGDELGTDFHGLNDAESIDQALLIHKSVMPNGTIDLVKLWDKPNGTFFGQDQPVEDYLFYLDKCHERESQLKPKVDSIVEQLISEAPRINNEVQAINRLSKISEQHMVEQAVFDDEINPRVFGLESAGYIIEARVQFAQGNSVAAFNATSRAKDTATSSCCPSGLKNSNGLEDPFLQDNVSENRDIEFVSKECPICHEKNVKTKVHKTSSGKVIISGDCGCAVIK